jgi:hypothetical protein
MPARDKKIKPVEINRVKRYSQEKRNHKTEIGLFARPIKNFSDSDFFDSLPRFLKVNDFKEYIDLIFQARRAKKPFHLLLGAHTIKVGLSPIIIDLMKTEIVTGFSFNCAGVIHDLELAFFGQTSEDVQIGLEDGSFGMVEETGDLFSEVCKFAHKNKIGLGEATGEIIRNGKAPNKQHSLFYTAVELGLPATVHAAIGADTVAQHPNFDGALVGEASYEDFKILAAICQEIDRGGVIANIGSAVLLPEVFLKALTVARNLNSGKSKLTTANFDMIMHYRPMVNVVSRPTKNAGKGFSFVGHHEIMIPLLAWGLKQKFAHSK